MRNKGYWVIIKTTNDMINWFTLKGIKCRTKANANKIARPYQHINNYRVEITPFWY